jgi:hypothetical protein
VGHFDVPLELCLRQYLECSIVETQVGADTPNRRMAATALSMRNFTILLASLILIVGSPVADAVGELKPLPKASVTEREAKGLITCTRDCGLRHKDPESRARCIGRAQASGQCSLVKTSQ